MRQCLKSLMIGSTRSKKALILIAITPSYYKNKGTRMNNKEIQEKSKNLQENVKIINNTLDNFKVPDKFYQEAKERALISNIRFVK